jgi:hypothetical protein
MEMRGVAFMAETRGGCQDQVDELQIQSATIAPDAGSRHVLKKPEPTELLFVHP